MGLNEQSILGKMATLNISRATLGPLAGMTEKELGRGLKGTDPLTGSEIERLDAILNDLAKLRDEIAPFLLPLEDHVKLRVMLEQFRDGFLVGVINRTVANGLREGLARARQ